MQWYDPNKFVPPRQEGRDESILVLVADEYYQLAVGCVIFDEEGIYWVEDDVRRSVIHHPTSWTFLPFAGKPGDPVEFPQYHVFQ